MNGGSEVLLHLHLPKTGGETLLQFIYRSHAAGRSFKDEGGYLIDGIYYYPRGIEEDAYPDDVEFHNEVDPPQSIVSALNRQDVSVVSGHFAYGLHRFIRRPSTYLTILRHPLDRVVSLYHHAVRADHNKRIHELVTTHGVGLDDFVSSIGYKQADNGQTRRLSGAEPPFGECTADMLDLAKRHLAEEFAAIGTLERFPESIRLISTRLGWNSGDPGDFEWQNVNTSRPPISSLSSRSRELILRHNQLDLELYRWADALLDTGLAEVRF